MSYSFVFEDLLEIHHSGQGNFQSDDHPFGGNFYFLTVVLTRFERRPSFKAKNKLI